MNLNATKRWTLYPSAPDALMRSTPEHPLLVQVLYNRGITSDPAMRAFLSDADAVRNNPYVLVDMDIAVRRIVRAIRLDEVICVYGDFDADGVTSTALMVMALQAAGARVGPYIPDRVDEGYGLNVDAIERIATQAQLIVTVDCGMRSLVEVQRANDLGLDVIITDHHSVGDMLPPALAVINPRRPECVGCFDRLAGVGVAYRLAQAVLREVARPDHPRLTPDRAEALELELLDLVALGTVADMMPLLGDNRSLVQRGLHRIAIAPRPGIAALMAQAGLSAGGVDATAISFRLGPRINAAGRLAHAKTAYDLLRTQDVRQAQLLATELEGLNRRRQSLVQDAQAEAEAQIAAQATEGPLMMVSSTRILPGIVGLVAGRLTERYYRPAVVIEQGEYESRGSARSIREFDISNALDQVRGLLVRYGGHSRAAGFTVLTSNLPAFAQALGEVAARELPDHAELRPTIDIDAEVRLSDMTWGVLDQFARLEPTGQDNPQPTLLSRGLRVRERRVVGGGRAHLKLTLDGGPQQPVFDAIGFSMGGLAETLAEGMRIDAAYNVEANEYGGRRTLQLNLRDLRSAETGTL